MSQQKGSSWPSVTLGTPFPSTAPTRAQPQNAASVWPTTRDAVSVSCNRNSGDRAPSSWGAFLCQPSDVDKDHTLVNRRFPFCDS